MAVPALTERLSADGLEDFAEAIKTTDALDKHVQLQVALPSGSVSLSAACKGAGMALMSLDPDMDGDVDVPGDNPESAEDAEDPLAEGEQETESQAADPAAATTETEGSMTETTSPAAETAPVIDQKALAEAVAGILDARDTAKAARKDSGLLPIARAGEQARDASMTQPVKRKTET